MDEWRSRVSLDRAICHGRPCIAGTRVLVTVVLDNLAEGMTPDEIVAEYPALTIDDVRAAISYGAYLARETEVAPLA